MSKKDDMVREQDVQITGGALEIPDGWFVCHADFDSEEPNIRIAPEHSSVQGKERTLPVPKSLAYYLRTHFCGSQRMHDNLQEDGRAQVRNAIKDVLKLGPET